jgi:hypothetical protein
LPAPPAGRRPARRTSRAVLVPLIPLVASMRRVRAYKKERMVARAQAPSADPEPAPPRRHWHRRAELHPQSVTVAGQPPRTPPCTPAHPPEVPASAYCRRARRIGGRAAAVPSPGTAGADPASKATVNRSRESPITDSCCLFASAGPTSTLANSPPPPRAWM